MKKGIHRRGAEYAESEDFDKNSFPLRSRRLGGEISEEFIHRGGVEYAERGGWSFRTKREILT